MRPTVVVLMGVAGVGKTTIGRLVAERLGWAFADADDLHPPENVAKMRRGEGLTDADRATWLGAVRALIARRLDAEVATVLACSALKARYRRLLRGADERVQVVWLDAPVALIAERLANRTGHFAGAELLSGQIDALEPPTDGEALRVEASGTPDETAREVLEAIRR